MSWWRKTPIKFIGLICAVGFFCIGWLVKFDPTRNGSANFYPFNGGVVGATRSPLHADSTGLADIKTTHADDETSHNVSTQSSLNADSMGTDTEGPGIAERRQRETKRIVQKYCKEHGRNLSMPKVSNFHVISSPPLLYCLMPKAASRELRKLLEALGRRRTLKETNLTIVRDRLSRPYKFTFVREPFERLLSAYKDKFIARRKMDYHILKKYGTIILQHFRPSVNQRSLKFLDDITFPEFIAYVVKEAEHDGFDIHWNTYEEQCNPCLIKYDFIGRYEFLTEDGNYMLKESGVNHVQFPKEKPYHTREELLQYYSQIPLEWILQLGRIYRSNFEMFGYPFPGPLEPLFANATYNKSVAWKKHDK